MSTRIFYFSATGNNFQTGTLFKKNLTDAVHIHSVAEFIHQSALVVDEHRIGLIFPVYFADLPQFVIEFVKKLKVKKDAYIFAVFTCNGVPGMALSALQATLKECGLELSLGRIIDLPGNAIPTSKREMELRLAALEEKVRSTAIEIEQSVVDLSLVKKGKREWLQKKLIGYFGSNYVVNPMNFKATDDCIECGLCQKVCVLDNIQYIEGKPVWGSECFRCLGCFHWCPKQAILIGGILSNRRRYHHPDVKVGDIILKK